TDPQVGTVSSIPDFLRNYWRSTHFLLDAPDCQNRCRSCALPFDAAWQREAKNILRGCRLPHVPGSASPLFNGARACGMGLLPDAESRAPDRVPRQETSMAKTLGRTHA